VPPSTRRILDELGFTAIVDAAGFHTNRGNSVWWGDRAVRHETFADDQPGFHVDRGSLEAVLVSAAERSGAAVMDRTTARSAEQTVEGWSVRCEPEGRARAELRASWVVDASGRRGLIARSEGRRPDRSTTTLALVQWWRRAGGWSVDHAHRTLVESYVDGWAWSVPLDAELRCFAAMVDGRPTEHGGTHAAEMLRSELAKTRHIGRITEGAVPQGDAWACPASLYTTARFGRPGLLLAGDAGSFIDPLSSFGVKKALSSGWLAGIAVHTALVDPAMTEAAVGFFDRREADVYRHYRRLSADFFEDAARVYGTSYWEKRASAARRAGGEESAGPADPDRLTPEVPEPDVRRAFDAIRSRPALEASHGSSLRTIRRPAIDGHRIVLDEHLASHAYPEGMRFVRGVDLRRLVASAPDHAEVPDAWAAYNGGAAPVTLPDYLAALATAFAAGFLEHSQD
jgi:flavin-dependent dehydrogenase